MHDPDQPPAPAEPLATLRRAAAARETAGLRRRLGARSPDHDGLLDLASNDYLGLNGDQRLADAAAAAARDWGTGSTGSRLVTGNTTLHAELERELAAFAAAPAALAFSSGYLANLAVITALAAALRAPAPAPGSPGVLIVSDELNHASLIDACRLSRARVTITPHRDPAAVGKALASRAEPNALVVTDAIFSVAGDLAPLKDLHQATRSHQALLVIDEAHSFGVLGQGGRGAAHAAGIASEPDVVRTITLSKSLAGQGGAVLGAEEVIDTLIDTGRSFIFDTGLAPACTGAALEALRVLQEDPSRGQRARTHARKLAAIAADLGLNTSQPDAAVIQIVLGEPDAAVGAKKVCAAEGVHVGCFRPPSVPPGQAALRLTARATMTEGDFATASRALAAVRDHVRITA